MSWDDRWPMNWIDSTHYTWANVGNGQIAVAHTLQAGAPGTAWYGWCVHRVLASTRVFSVLEYLVAKVVLCIRNCIWPQQPPVSQPPEVREAQIAAAKDKIRRHVWNSWETHTFPVTAFTPNGDAYAVARTVSGPADQDKMTLLFAGANEPSLRAIGTTNDVDLFPGIDLVPRLTLEVSGITARVYPSREAPPGGLSLINEHEVTHWVPKFSIHDKELEPLRAPFPTPVLNIVLEYCRFEAFSGIHRTQLAKLCFEDHTQGAIRLGTSNIDPRGSSVTPRYYSVPTSLATFTYQSFTIVVKPVVGVPGVIEYARANRKDFFDLWSPRRYLKDRIHPYPFCRPARPLTPEQGIALVQQFNAAKQANVRWSSLKWSPRLGVGEAFDQEGTRYMGPIEGRIIVEKEGLEARIVTSVEEVEQERKDAAISNQITEWIHHEYDCVNWGEAIHQPPYSQLWLQAQSQAS